MITIQGNGRVQTIVVIETLNQIIKQLKILLCFEFQYGIIDEKENLLFKIEPQFFSIIIIELPKLFNIKVHIFDCSITIVDNVSSTIDFEQQNYLFTYYQLDVGNMIIDEFARDRVKDLQIINWTLRKEEQFWKNNLGIFEVPQFVKIN